MCGTDANEARCGADTGEHVPIACFGERGMHQGSGGAARPPLAAGLFGVASASTPCPVPPASGVAFDTRG